MEKSTTSKGLTKIFFELDIDEWHGYGTESVWAERISDNRYRLCNTPFFAKGVSFEDIIFAKEEGEVLVYKSTSIAAGHSTYRILMQTTLPESDFLDNWYPLEEIGCSYESMNRGEKLLYAIDVPSKTDINGVYNLLEEGEKNGVWVFEEGHCGHAV